DFSYPKTIALTFSNSKVVYISTAEYSAGHRYHVVRGVSGLVVATKQTTVEQHTCSEGNK
ncbi:MAG TPA: hypothetical protein VGN63_00490, partial [Flavisolibacter sp.]|nr:hypothetical protein [Flavisolibacter sp.]